MLKKILFGIGAGMLVLASLMTGFVNSSQTEIMTLSTLVCAFMILLVYSLLEKNWSLLSLSALTVFTHCFYLLSKDPNVGFLFLTLAALSLLASAGILFWQSGKDPSCKRLLGAALLAKVCLLPEVILNFLIYRSSGASLFASLSWALLAITSLYALLAIYLCWQRKLLSGNWALCAGLFQLCFGSDIIACIGVLLVLILHKPVSPESKTPLYANASFSKQKKSRIHKG